jgi:hypothetical protein
MDLSHLRWERSYSPPLRPPDDRALDLGGALEDGAYPGDRGSLRRSAACGTPWYQHGFSTPCPRRIPVSARPLHAAYQGQHVLGGHCGPRWIPSPTRHSGAGTSEVHFRADLPVSLPNDVRRGPAARTGRTRPGRPWDAGKTRDGRCYANTAALRAGQAMTRPCR